ncbi:hypothetical protein ACPCIR_02950 [Mycobacterium sp. NPDC051198]
MSWWTSIFTPGLVAAGVTLLTNWWLQRPRADLHMVVGAQSLDDADRLLRGNQGDTNTANHPHWQPLFFVRLTNHGDGIAHNVKLTGERCRPRVWIGDSGMVPAQGKPAEIAYPLWSNTVAALGPGDSVNIYVMGSLDRSLAKPVIEASWPRLPGRRWDWRKSTRYDLASARRIEEGWPGEKEM